jgi:hypothetical protein
MCETLGTPNVTDAHFGDRHKLLCERAQRAPLGEQLVIRAYGDF